ncbi:MAG: cytochrome c biogenesis protein CcdA [Planctomycetota bacterium]
MRQQLSHAAQFSFASRWICLLLAGFTLALPAIDVPAHGQDTDGEAGLAEDYGADAGIFPNFSLGGFGDSAVEEPVQWTARYFASADGKAKLEVEASLLETWHIYSTTQPSGGPTRTTFSLIAPDNAELSGTFTPDHPPKKSVSSDYNGLTVEEHEGVVIWSADVTLPAGFQEEIRVRMQGLVCKSGDDNSNRCMPVEATLTAEFAGTLEESKALVAQRSNIDAEADAKVAKPFRDGKYVVEWTAVVKPTQLKPGDKGVLLFTAKPDATYHVYKSVTDDTESSTNFVLTEKSGLLVGAPVADKKYVTKTILPSLPPVNYYKGNVTWQLPFEVPKDATAGEKVLSGLVAYQACTDTSCQRPVALKFEAKVTVGSATETKPAAIELVTARSAQALDAAAEADWVDDVKLEAVQNDDEESLATAVSGGNSNASTGSFLVILGLAFLGGLILNVMPCVLPVVGLKIMGFVSQAGEDRRRILTLNLVYVLGIMTVFAVFAVVAAVSKFGWGEQFTYFPVKFGLTIALFALALSYLGVWEIPVPGMAAGKASQDLQSREGAVGAFSKGVFATILATPCSGPLLGYILGLTLNLSPMHTIAIFLMVGLGMSFPYIVIGFQPRLVSWLPKPGPWMETLKQLMSFLFLGTVAFFFAQFDENEKLPVFISLMAVWFGCWIIGQVPNWAELQKRLLAWAGGIAAATLISVWAFTSLQEKPDLQWVDYSELRLQEFQSEGRTVMVDFGAKWCLTCNVNYQVAIDTDETRVVVEELDAIAMYADWTDYSDEIKQKLEELDSRSIPLLAIYPGDRPSEPIILRDLISQQDVIDALREAGASVTNTTSNEPDSNTKITLTRG